MKEIIERDEEKNTCLVARCENCGRLHVYKRERKDVLECFLKHEIWMEITLFGGIEVE